MFGTSNKKIDLISSIFDRIDIGKFVFVKLPYKEDSYSYQILDGKQRLNTIIEFYEDRFKYKGKLFSELSWIDQSNIKNHPISVAEIRDEDATEEKVIEYFIRLNISGTPVEKSFLENLKETYLK